MLSFERKKSYKNVGRAAVAISIILLIFSGVVYRLLAARLNVIAKVPVKLSVPLSSFPRTVLNWTGKDVPVSESTKYVAGCNDYLNRLFVSADTKQWANVYVAYYAQPGTMLGHRPIACYVASGWIHDTTAQSEIFALSGKKIPCLLHRFHKPGPENEDTVVLNFYVVNGEPASQEGGFSGVTWRIPNIRANAARYVAQVQISSVLESSVRSVARDLTDVILDYLPGSESKVPQTENQRQRKVAASDFVK